jgi:hypothetical protein
MDKKLIKLVKQTEVQELVAFGWTNQDLPYYTIRDSILNASLEVIKEVPAVFGYPYADVVVALETYTDIDKKFYPTPLF